MKLGFLITALTLGSTICGAGQTVSPPPAQLVVGAPIGSGAEFTRFNIDFPGGPPAELAETIKTATGRPLNVIIPAEFRDVRLPAFKMSNVTVPELFKAIEAASERQEVRITGSAYRGGSSRPVHNYEIVHTGYGFRSAGPVNSEDAIWFFYVQKPTQLPPVEPEKVCRFYRLSPYLAGGLTVDDVTTAIRTGWKMLREEEAPELSFHKETELLIAVGDAHKLETIDAVLSSLAGAPPAPAGRRGPSRAE